MNRIIIAGSLCIALIAVSLSCGRKVAGKKNNYTENNKMIGLITVDPGHFHAALVQKMMYERVSPDVHVYAPAGDDLNQHLERISLYNSRKTEPTHWNEIVYQGDDFFERMLYEKAGDVVVLAGNNKKKAEYIERSVNAGLNVLADKPVIISSVDYPRLEKTIRKASEKKVLVFDIMTERFEIATILQKALSQNRILFGDLLNGTKDEPAVTKISIHHFSKLVSGIPLKRPAWFFDTGQQGEGIVDVTTHLVDLVQWECYPDSLLDKSDVSVASARRWATEITREQFRSVTGLKDFPPFLSGSTDKGILRVFSNGEFTWKLKNTWAKVSVEWKFQAPPGGGDTHFSEMKGTKCKLIIKQTADEKFLPVLYVENIVGGNINELEIRLKEALKSVPFDSLTCEKCSENILRINIPSKYRVSHEEHFAQVMARFLDYLREGKLPDWEPDAMLTKYYTTTSALELASKR